MTFRPDRSDLLRAWLDEEPGNDVRPLGVVKSGYQPTNRRVQGGTDELSSVGGALAVGAPRWAARTAHPGGRRSPCCAPSSSSCSSPGVRRSTGLAGR